MLTTPAKVQFATFTIPPADVRFSQFANVPPDETRVTVTGVVVARFPAESSAAMIGWVVNG